MSKYVLDASALLALLNDEPGSDQVQAALPNSIISAVNYSEVVTRLSLLGMPEVEIQENLNILGLEITSFDPDIAFQAGVLAKKTKNYGLSLGDRCCLALALKNEMTALTADRIWLELNIGVKVATIR